MRYDVLFYRARSPQRQTRQIFFQMQRRFRARSLQKYAYLFLFAKKSGPAFKLIGKLTTFDDKNMNRD